MVIVTGAGAGIGAATARRFLVAAATAFRAGDAAAAGFVDGVLLPVGGGPGASHGRPN